MRRRPGRHRCGRFLGLEPERPTRRRRAAGKRRRLGRATRGGQPALHAVAPGAGPPGVDDGHPRLGVEGRQRPAPEPGHRCPHPDDGVGGRSKPGQRAGRVAPLSAWRPAWPMADLRQPEPGTRGSGPAVRRHRYQPRPRAGADGVRLRGHARSDRRRVGVRPERGRHVCRPGRRHRVVDRDGLRPIADRRSRLERVGIQPRRAGGHQHRSNASRHAAGRLAAQNPNGAGESPPLLSPREVVTPRELKRPFHSSNKPAATKLVRWELRK